jgi:AmiR/NasT family two-component response regulator
VTAFSQRETIERATAAGVLGYLVKPFGRADLAPAIEIAVARWQQMRDLAAQVDTLKDRQAARDVVDRAKRHLQQNEGFSEPAAFAALRRAAMDGRVTLAEAAVRILDEYQQK